MTKITTTPPENRTLVLTREAAKAIGCSMSLMRWLARTGRVKSWKLGPRSVAFDLDECMAYKKQMTAVRNAAKKAGGRARGSEPKGFSPDKYYG